MTALNLEVAPIARSQSAFAAAGASEHSHVDWGAVLAGTVLAAAISTVMTAFGAAIGLSATSPYYGQGWNGSATAVALATTLWVLWISISSFAAGAYLVARMRRLTFDSSTHEREIRDGVHGLLVWAAGALLLAYLGASAVAGVAKPAQSTVAVGASGVEVSGEMPYIADQVLRNANPGAPALDSGFRDQINRSFSAAALNGAMPADERAAVIGEIAARTGITTQDAGKRVDDALLRIDALRDKMRAAADKARRAGVLVAFLAGVSIIIGAAAAWWAASIGGKHRDEQMDLTHLTAWR